MARKLKLDLETLSVESFDVAREHRERGTVFGKSVNPTDPEYNSYDMCEYTSPGSDSYGEYTCGWTCGYECGQSLGGGGSGGSYTPLSGNDEIHFGTC
jgi:hypothetical protein